MFVKYDINSYSPILPEGKEVIIVSTDSKKFNELVDGGLMTGDFYLIQACSGAGKTTLCERLMLRTVISGQKAAYISMGEQKPEVLYEKLMCMNRKKRYNDYRLASSEDRKEYYEKVMESKFGKELKDRIQYYYTRDPFSRYKLPEEGNNKKTTCDTTEIFKDIIAENIRFVFVDYVGASTEEGEKARTELKKFCDGLSYLAEEYGLCIVGAIQTNRKYDEEDSKGELNPAVVNASYVADSINTVRKATCCISFIRKQGSSEAYLNVYKSRNGNTGLIKIYIEPYSYRWSDEPLLPFEEI